MYKSHAFHSILHRQRQLGMGWPFSYPTKRSHCVMKPQDGVRRGRRPQGHFVLVIELRTSLLARLVGRPLPGKIMLCLQLNHNLELANSTKYQLYRLFHSNVYTRRLSPGIGSTESVLILRGIAERRYPKRELTEQCTRRKKLSQIGNYHSALCTHACRHYRFNRRRKRQA